MYSKVLFFTCFLTLLNDFQCYPHPNGRQEPDENPLLNMYPESSEDEFYKRSISKRQEPGEYPPFDIYRGSNEDESYERRQEPSENPPFDIYPASRHQRSNSKEYARIGKSYHPRLRPFPKGKIEDDNAFKERTVNDEPETDEKVNIPTVKHGR